MKLYHLTEQLAYDVDRIDAVSEAITSAIQQQPSLKKGLEPFQSKLMKLKDSLVVMKGDNYVGSAEPMLREKLSALYSEVASYYGLPTAAQMENLTLLENVQTESRKKIETYMSKDLPALNKKLASAKLSEVQLRSFETFKEASK